MNKVLVTCMHDFVGVSAVFENMQALGLCDFKYADDLFPSGMEGYDLLILGAWHPIYESRMEYFKGKKAVLWTSSIGQMTMTANEVEIFYLPQLFKMLREKKIDYLFFGSYDLYEVNENCYGVKFFPYPVDLNKYQISTKKDLNKPYIGLFCPQHFRKNFFNQIYAFYLANRKKAMILHTNIKVEGRDILNYLWMSQKELFELVSQMKLILHISHTESFCYAVVEAIMLGTLPIISPCIRDNLNLPNEICVDNPDSAIKISEKILELMNLADMEYFRLIFLCQERIRKLAYENNQKLRELIENLINF